MFSLVNLYSDTCATTWFLDRLYWNALGIIRGFDYDGHSSFHLKDKMRKTTPLGWKKLDDGLCRLEHLYIKML